MKTIDIKNKKVTVLGSITGYTNNGFVQTNMTLNQIMDLGYTYRHAIAQLRKMEYDSKEQKEKKSKFPSWFVGGTFPYNHHEDVEILEYSNLLAIDIDKHVGINENIDFDKLKHTLFELPYVILVSDSIRGNGIYVLVLVEDGRYTKEYYTYIAKLWSKQYDIVIDTHCTNIGRKRCLSYDENMLIKSDDMDIQAWKVKYIEKKIEVKKNNNTYMSKYKPKQDDDFNKEFTRKAIWHLLNNGYSIDNIRGNELYGIWYHIACDFKHFEDGEDMFVRFSTNTTKYVDDIKTILKKWNNAKIEMPFEEISRKWCGICKRIHGKDWYKQNYLFDNITKI